MPRIAWLALAWLLMGQPAFAVILYGLGNGANQSDPGTGVPYASVGKLSDGSTIRGSGIYLGNGWMLTADHLGAFNSITFDGVTNYAWNGATPVTLGTSDMKLFRLASLPSVPAVPVYSGTGELFSPATLVGWGVGRNGSSPINTNSVGWGDDTTSAKRWGLNTPLAFANLNDGSHSYEAIRTVLGSSTGSPAGLGESEAAATMYDSGSGLFREIGGTWYLIGLTTGVEAGGTSVFGNDQTADPNGHFNYFVRVSNYQSSIMAIIPEPGTTWLAGIGIIFLWRRRR